MNHPSPSPISSWDDLTQKDEKKKMLANDDLVSSDKKITKKSEIVTSLFIILIKLCIKFIIFKSVIATGGRQLV